MDGINALLLQNEAKHPQRVYLRQPRRGEWILLTWQQVMDQARRVASALLDFGLKPGDRVAILSKNCAEWFIADFAITLAGVINVPLFPNQHPDSVRYILEHAGIKLIFLGKVDNAKRVRDSLPSKLPTIGFDYYPELSVSLTWAQALQKKPLIEIATHQSDDIYTIIYTSGTAGPPKGAYFTHGSIAKYLTLFAADLKRDKMKSDYFHFVSYLPLAHVYERTAIQLGSLCLPCDVSFIEGFDKFAHHLEEIQPTYFTAVPRIWGVFKQKIEKQISPKKLNVLLKIPGVAWYVKKRIRRRLGLARCEHAYSAASQLPIDILTFFDKLGIYIQEGYGQTENMAYATFVLLKNRQLGYVGTARLKVELVLAENDELLVRSPCLMKGYYRDPELTAKTLVDGWLHTGDLAEIDSEGRVKILGRLSENYKNQSGEFVAPSGVEKRFAENDYVEELCLVGQGLSKNIMLLTLNNSARKLTQEQITTSLRKQMQLVNRQLSTYEKIGHVFVATIAWTVENDLLTPTSKVKRKMVEAKYSPILENVIESGEAIVWEESHLFSS